MKTNISSIVILLALCSFCLADAIDDDIASAQTVDELIQKMSQSQNQHKYRYMNAIKQKIASINTANRAEKIDEIMDKIEKNNNQDNKAKSSISKGGFSNANNDNAGGNDNSGGNGGGNGGGGRN